MTAVVGIQIGAISFVDEGTGAVLDVVRERAGASAVFVATQSFDRGVQGRQVAGRPYPGHGPRGVDDHSGGSYVAQHPEYYGGTVLGPYRARDAEIGGFDALGDVIPEARRRNMKVYSFVLENTHSGLTRNVPNWPKVLQIDAWGRADPYACLRNPDYLNWWLGIVEDQVKSYDLDGIMWGSERNGPLGNVLNDGGFARDGAPYCFCPHCVEAGARQGIDASRAKEGYRRLHFLAHEVNSDHPDTKFVRFLRLLGQYPEIAQWDALWHEGYEAFQQQLYGTIKFLAPEVDVGWHVWHHNSFSPLYRAQMDFDKLADYSNFIKPVLYNNCAGYRLHHHISLVTRSIFEGLSEQTVYDFYRGVLGYGEDIRFEDLPSFGLSPDYVRREVERTVRAVGGRAAVYPGLDVGVPTPDHVKQTSPQDIHDSVIAALEGGADGVLLSRKYSEMTWDNLAAVGAALRDWA